MWGRLTTASRSAHLQMCRVCKVNARVWWLHTKPFVNIRPSSLAEHAHLPFQYLTDRLVARGGRRRTSWKGTKTRRRGSVGTVTLSSAS
jgi:hypothetical protein